VEAVERRKKKMKASCRGGFDIEGEQGGVLVRSKKGPWRKRRGEGRGEYYNPVFTSAKR